MAKARKSKIVTISSTKGGVGKSLFALNMAGIYSLMEKKVLLIDLDLTSGSLAMSLNKPYDKSIYNIVEDLKNNVYDKFEDYTIKYNDFISCLPSPKDPRKASLIDIRYIEPILARACDLYDVILIDTSHDLSSLNLFLLEYADQIWFLINNDPLNLKNMKSLLTILNNMDIKYKIILNNANNPYKNYFSLYDIKNIIKANIDYSISPELYLSNIDSYIMSGLIPSLDPDAPRTFNKDYATLVHIATSILKEGDKND